MAEQRAESAVTAPQDATPVAPEAQALPAPAAEMVADPNLIGETIIGSEAPLDSAGTVRLAGEI